MSSVEGESATTGLDAARAAVFQARGLEKIYRVGDVEVRALRGVDLDVLDGELLVLRPARATWGCGGAPRGRACTRPAASLSSAAMRILHTMLRVGDLERSLGFYTGVLGMKLLRRQDFPEGRFTLAFVGYGPESEQAAIELTHNWDTKGYELGGGFGHVALEVPDAYAACADIRQRGGTVVREAGPMKHGTTVIAFVQDPDGYRIELIQRAS